MAFTTVQGAGSTDATSYLGTSASDSIALANVNGNIFAGGRASADSIFITNSGTALYNGVVNALTLKGDGVQILLATQVQTL